MNTAETAHPSPAIRNLQKDCAARQYAEHEHAIAVRVDRIFAVLLALQWVVGIGAALAISPRTWIGAASSLHIHVWAAVVLGGLLSGFPIVLVLVEAGRRSNRYVIAVAQMLSSALLIHLTGGRIETHFHVFGSLAFLSLYRDWRVLGLATLTIAADHIARGLFWPESVFGFADASLWRSLEHAGWVLFEDSVLIVACVQSQREMRQLASRWAELSAMNDVIDDEVHRQVAEVRRSEQRLLENEQRLLDIVNTACDSFVELDDHCRIMEWSRRAQELFGWTQAEALGKNIGQLLGVAELVGAIAARPSSDAAVGQRLETIARNRCDQELPVEVSLSRLQTRYRGAFYLFFHDITDRRHLQMQLVHAQKMESIGQLTAGVAHEINTPTQFAGDNLSFLQNAFQDLNGVFECLDADRLPPERAKSDRERWEAIVAAGEAADLTYLRSEIPKAIAQSLEGVQRIATITKSMKEFSHPGTVSMSSINLQQAIDSTLVVCRNEWKYLAEIVTDYDPALTMIDCFPGELNQVLLNLIVNAAQAIGEHSVNDPGRKGLITISTRLRDQSAEISVTDNGPGIPEAILGRVFDPFFTTKPVGKGTGQGLAIAHAVIVEKHHGTIQLKSKIGEGTTFVIRVPVTAPLPFEESARHETPCLVCG